MSDVADRVMFIDLKTGHSGDSGPSWISLVRFNKSWKTAYWHGCWLARWEGPDSNFFDLETNEEFWVFRPEARPHGCSLQQYPAAGRRRCARDLRSLPQGCTPTRPRERLRKRIRSWRRSRFR